MFFILLSAYLICLMIHRVGPNFNAYNILEMYDAPFFMFFLTYFPTETFMFWLSSAWGKRFCPFSPVLAILFWNCIPFRYVPIDTDRYAPIDTDLVSGCFEQFWV